MTNDKDIYDATDDRADACMAGDPRTPVARIIAAIVLGWGIVLMSALVRVL